jgi:predicted lipoprotein with Yx(FWY)xxD motif
MRHLFGVIGVLALVSAAPVLAAETVKASAAMREDYIRVPMPAGFQVVPTELEGPVFADAHGKTLYIWPFRTMRVGTTGDNENISSCDTKPSTETAGMMSPYPPGLLLPELDKRLSCAQVWPPVYAADTDKPVGGFSIITRSDGKKQWAFNKRALYTSNLDKAPGDVMGATGRRERGDGPAEREPVGPAPNVPPGFAVLTTAKGRLLLTDKNYSVYTYDKDQPNKSLCDEKCARVWEPVIAPAAAQAGGEWSVIQRAPGVRQWAFRKKPLYTYTQDTKSWSYQGSDNPGWRNVFTQEAPPLPKGFTVVDNEVGETVTDPKGRTVYFYTCGDDSKDQLACDHPAAPQAYRIAVCGGGSVEKCNLRWPYLVAAADAKSTSRSWTIMEIDPKTGHYATPGQAGALRVWAYRDRPLFNFYGDKKPGDIYGNTWGEFNGKRNGFRAFVVRDDFFDASN